MSKRTMALAAVLLACGAGAASAQGQMPGEGSGQQRTVAPPYSQQVPDTVPLRPHIDKPKINPSAAGTLRERESRGSRVGTDDVNREHTGSVGVNGNAHPLESLKARGKPREEGITAPPGIQPTPRSTMNRAAGR